MLTFKGTLERFAEKGEKTGWTYIHISSQDANLLNPGTRKSYRVKGKLDAVIIKQQSILPMGDGDFILPVKEELRKKLKKPLGETIVVQLEVDYSAISLDEELLLCLQDVPEAYQKFVAMPLSHQRYYSNHVSNAKTDTTRAKRIANIIESMLRDLSFAEMLKMK